VNEEALAHWGAVAPKEKRRKRKNKIIGLTIYLLNATLYSFTQVKQLPYKIQEILK